MKKIIAAFVCFLIAMLGSTNEEALIIIFAEILFSAICIFIDLSKGYRHITFITFYSLFTSIYLISNYFVINSIGTPDQYIYDYYLITDNLSQSALITFIGNIALVSGYEIYNHYKFPNAQWISLDSQISYSWYQYLFLIILINTFCFLIGFNIDFIDKITALVIFILARHFASNNNTKSLKWLMALAVVLAFKAVLYSYRRQEIFEPIFFFLIGYLVGYKSFSVLNKAYLIPLYISLGVSIIIFSTLGSIRTTKFGNNRAAYLLKKYTAEEDQNNPNIYADEEEEEEEDKGSFLARNSNINQLTQVVKLAERDGFYGGETFAYMAYAFIPRFLWPEKPLIMQGRWFALRAGLAYNHGSVNSLAKVNNSVNMTVAGEFYLNFSYLGVFIGMLIIGAFMCFLWELSGFWSSDSNVFGTIFGGYLIVVALHYLNVDLQFLVTTLSLLFSLVIANLMIKFLYKVSV